MQRSVLLSFKIITPTVQKLDGILPAWLKENEKVAKEMEADFKKTTRTWKNRVQFVKELLSGSGRIGIRIFTQDKVWKYLDEGTRAHFIPVGRKGFLAWRETYKAKTTPGTIPAVAGGASGSWVFSRKGHMVRGIEARNWTDLIYKKWHNLYYLRMQAKLTQELKNNKPGSKITRLG